MSNTVQQAFGEAANGTEGRTVDDVYEVLADERRRLAVASLAEMRPPVDGATLARSVAAAEAAAPTDEVSDDRAKRVHARLYHVHLPKLDEAGLVEYDPDDDTVGDVADDVDALPF